MDDTGPALVVEHAVRALSTALKTARLYPPSSPIPEQSALAAAAALADAFASTGAPVLPFVVGRDGLMPHGSAVASGAQDLAELLAAHGIAEIAFTPDVTAEDVTVFLNTTLADPASVRVEGGLAAAIEAAGVTGVHVSAAALTIVEHGSADNSAEAIDFLASLARDPAAIASWLESMRDKDPHALAEGLAALAEATGPDGVDHLAAMLARSFSGLDQQTKDALLSAGIHDESARATLSPALARIDPRAIATALAHGAIGANMLSLSNALARLPLGARMQEVLAHTKPLLEELGHSRSEVEFLDHMLEVRLASEPETPLTERLSEYRRAAEMAELSAADLDSVRRDASESAGRAPEHAVRLMLDLLDQQHDFEMYCKALEGLATTVPALIAARRLDLARTVIESLSSRIGCADLPWPELAERISEAVAHATHERAMNALFHAAAADERLTADARAILSAAGPAAATAFMRAAISARDIDGLRVAEQVLGRRVIDIVIAMVPTAQWFEAGQIASLLSAHEADPRARAALDALLARNDPRLRQETARGLTGSLSPHAVRRLGALARDAAPEVRAAAIRALGHARSPGAVDALRELFDEIDADGKDFAVAREIILVLGACENPEAERALEHIAGRKAFIKRGRFTEVNDLARQVLQSRRQGGVRR